MMNRSLSISDDQMGSLVQHTQNDARKFFETNNNTKMEYSQVYRRKAYKTGRKRLVCVFSSVINTNGKDRLVEDDSSYKYSTNSFLVPWLGVDKSKLEIAESVMIDIDAESTFLPVFCKILIIHQGAAQVNSPPVLARDAGIQVGQNFWLMPISLNKQPKENDDEKNTLSTSTSADVTKSRRNSWVQMDEYYSVPHYQYRGKRRYNQTKDTQVSDINLINNAELNKLDLNNKIYSTKSIDTNDLVNHVKLDSFTNLELMSIDSLHTKSTINPNDQSTKLKIVLDKNLKKRYRKVTNLNKSKLNSNLINVKRYESKCPLSGTRRLTLIMPFVNANNNLNDSNEMDSSRVNDPSVEQYEEYYVIDSSVDTQDLVKCIKFEIYTAQQLLDEKIVLTPQIINNGTGTVQTEPNKISKLVIIPSTITKSSEVQTDDSSSLNQIINKTGVSDSANNLKVRDAEMKESLKLITQIDKKSNFSLDENTLINKILMRPSSKGMNKTRTADTGTLTDKSNDSNNTKSQKFETNTSNKSSTTPNRDQLTSSSFKYEEYPNKTKSTQTDVGSGSSSSSTNIKKNDLPKTLIANNDQDDISDILERYKIKETDLPSSRTPRVKTSNQDSAANFKNLIQSIDNKLGNIARTSVTYSISSNGSNSSSSNNKVIDSGAYLSKASSQPTNESSLTKLIKQYDKDLTDLAKKTNGIDSKELLTERTGSTVSSTSKEKFSPSYSNLENYQQDMSEYYTNHAKYPLISKAIHKPQSLRIDRTNGINLVHFDDMAIKSRLNDLIKRSNNLPHQQSVGTSSNNSSSSQCCNASRDRQPIHMENDMTNGIQIANSPRHRSGSEHPRISLIQNHPTYREHSSASHCHEPAAAVAPPSAATTLNLSELNNDFDNPSARINHPNHHHHHHEMNGLPPKGGSLTNHFTNGSFRNENGTLSFRSPNMNDIKRSKTLYEFEKDDYYYPANYNICRYCQRKKRTRRSPRVNEMSIEQPILIQQPQYHHRQLVLQNENENQFNYIRNVSQQQQQLQLQQQENDEQIVFIPALISNRSKSMPRCSNEFMSNSRLTIPSTSSYILNNNEKHYMPNYAHQYLDLNNDANLINTNSTRPNRYRRAKYDKSLFMYTNNNNNNSNKVDVESSNDSDATSVLIGTAVHQIDPFEDLNNEQQQQQKSQIPNDNNNNNADDAINKSQLKESNTNFNRLHESDEKEIFI